MNGREKNMRYEEKRATLTDGTIILLRSPASADAEASLQYLDTTARETEFLLYNPGERTLTLEQEQQWLEGRISDPRGVQIGAFKDGTLVGMAGVSQAVPFNRGAHRASVGIAIVKDIWHLGLGTILMREAIAAAQRMGYEKLELAVCAANERAKRLYDRYGFKTYGVNQHAFKYQDGHYDDEQLMALDLTV